MSGVEWECQKAEVRFHADACAAAATSRLWVMMTAQTQTLALKPHQNARSLLRERLSGVQSAWISAPLQPSELPTINLSKRTKCTAH